MEHKICIIEISEKECLNDDYGTIVRYVSNHMPWTIVNDNDYYLLNRNLHLLNKNGIKYILLRLPENQEELINLTVDNAKKEIEKEQKRREKEQKEYELKNKKKLEAKKKIAEKKALLKKAIELDLEKFKEIIGVNNE